MKIAKYYPYITYKRNIVAEGIGLSGLALTQNLKRRFGMSEHEQKGRVKTIPRRRIARFGKGISILLVALAVALVATSGIHPVETGTTAVEK